MRAYPEETHAILRSDGLFPAAATHNQNLTFIDDSDSDCSELRASHPEKTLGHQKQSSVETKLVLRSERIGAALSRSHFSAAPGCRDRTDLSISRQCVC